MNCASVSFSGGKFSLTKDLYVNSGLIGPFDSTSNVDVFLKDSIGNLITPTGSTLVGNDLTINLPISSGIIFQFPSPSQCTSYAIGDTGWRYQNGWYNFNPPAYPAKKAELDPTAGANTWFVLKTPLTVGGISSTVRFVDINGQQTFSAANNGNVAVIDKLTGLMFTRNISANGQTWAQQLSGALSYSVTINSITYDDWYLIGHSDWMSIFGFVAITTTFTDTLSGINLIALSSVADRQVRVADTSPNNPLNVSYGWEFGFYSPTSGLNKSSTNLARVIYVRDARNLIS